MKVPPNGIPPLSLYGLALRVVMVSKQIENETAGCSATDIVMELDVAGLPEIQDSLDVRMQDT